MEQAGRNALRLSSMIFFGGLLWIALSHTILSLLTRNHALSTLLELFVNTIFLLLVAITVFLLSRAGLKRKLTAERNLDASRESFTLLFDNSELAYMVMDRETRLINVNEQWTRLTGFSSAESLGTSFSSYMLQPYRNNFQSLYSEQHNEGVIGSVLIEILTKSSESRLIEIHGRSVPVPESGEMQFHCLLHDITRQARSQQLIVRSEDRYRALINSINDAIFILEDSSIIDCNRKAEELFEGSRDQLLGLHASDLSPEYQVSGVLSSVEERKYLDNLAKEQNTLFDWKYKTLRGRMFDGEISLALMQGYKKLSIAVIRDVSDRVRSERAREEAEERFRLAFHTSPDAIGISRLSDGCFVAMNEGFLHMTGYTHDELKDKSSLDVGIWINSDDRKKFQEMLEKDGMIRNYESLFRLKDGSIHTCLMSARIIELYEEPHILSITRDIEDIKRAEAARHETEEKYRLLVENSLDGIYLIQDRKIIFCNRILAEMLAFDSPEDVNGIDLRKIVSDQSWQIVVENLRRRETGELKNIRYELFMRKKTGEELPVEVLGSRMMYQGKPAIQGVMRDISERKKMQRQLDQAIRLESVGRLAGGVAHDFNNLLTAIVGHAELGLFQLEKDHPFRSELEEILSITERGSNLTQQLLTFSKNQVLQQRITKLSTIILNIERMLERILGEDIHMTYELVEDDWPVKIDQSQIDQAIVNLCINARDAMPDGGNLLLKLENQVVEKEECFFQLEPFSGEYVVLTIQDDGMGMEKDVLEKVFDVFYTTKPIGKGTGLGLSTVYGAISNAGGHLQVESKPKEGTRFTFFIPRAAEAVVEESNNTTISIKETGTERIVLVEDNSSVRNAIEKSLQAHGYHVKSTPSGLDVIRACIDNNEWPDLIISDVVMPEIRGTELAKQLRKVRPNVKILLISGYREPAEDSLIEEMKIPFLQKPFSMNTLLQTIRNLLDSKSASKVG